MVESNAGASAKFSDADYQAAGARIVTAKEALGADVVMKVYFVKYFALPSPSNSQIKDSYLKWCIEVFCNQRCTFAFVGKTYTPCMSGTLLLFFAKLTVEASYMMLCRRSSMCRYCNVTIPCFIIVCGVVMSYFSDTVPVVLSC